MLFSSQNNNGGKNAMKKIHLYIVTSICLGIAAIFWLKEPSQKETISDNSTHNKDEQTNKVTNGISKNIEEKTDEINHQNNMAESYQQANNDAEIYEEEQLTDAEKEALLNDPTVKDYLAQKESEAALDDYFNNEKSLHEDEAIWELIENIEKEGRIAGFEAMAIKLLWLQKNSTDETAYEESARRLLNQYKEKSEKAAAEYDPNDDVPGFTEYKQEEAQIIEEVNTMQAFPNGMSKDAYLRERLLEARIKYFN